MEEEGLESLESEADGLDSADAGDTTEAVEASEGADSAEADFIDLDRSLPPGLGGTDSDAEGEAEAEAESDDEPLEEEQPDEGQGEEGDTEADGSNGSEPGVDPAAAAEADGLAADANKPAGNRAQERRSAPGSLADRSQRQFQRVAKGRGRDYFARGRVSPPAREGDVFKLSVVGSGENYGVTIDCTDIEKTRTMKTRCDCPYYAGGGLCKHIWAAILQLDQAGFTSVAPGTGGLRVQHEARAQARAQQQAQHAQNSQHGRNRDRNQRGRGRGGHGGGLQTDLLGNFEAPPPTTWQERLGRIRTLGAAENEGYALGSWSSFYVINAAETNQSGRLTVDLWIRVCLRPRELGPLRPHRLAGAEVSRFADPKDREVLSLLARTGDARVFTPFGRSQDNLCSRFTVNPILEAQLMPQLLSAGKLFLSRSPNGSPDEADRPLRVDRGTAPQLDLRVEYAGLEHYRLDGVIRRGTEARSLADPVCVLRSGYLIFPDRVSQITDARQAAWAYDLRHGTEFRVPRAQGELLVEGILTSPGAPRLTWPSEIAWTQVLGEPKPRGMFAPLGGDPSNERMTMTVSFDYGGRDVSLNDQSHAFVDTVNRRVLQRNVPMEEKALHVALRVLKDQQGTGTFPTRELHRVASELAAEGWEVYMDERKLRTTQDFAIDVKSSTDWFDLSLGASFDGKSVTSEQLLEALKRKDGLVRLADGSLGMVPPDWLAKFGSLKEFGEAGAGGTLRFSRAQGFMLGAALEGDVHVRADSDFLELREKIRAFTGIQPASAPEGFKGKLRSYQQEGLAWLGFVDEFKMGGILADDMGLGKTIQVLAFIQSRKKALGSGRPTLVVAPKSLVFNWIDEASRFVPDLRVESYSGPGRSKKVKDFPKIDVLVTTYGTLRTDIEKLQETEFDLAIVDEAQAIKNATSQSAQAVKQIRADRRLALTGTPIENSIQDLFSILEFTSPGALDLPKGSELSKEALATLGRMVKPFILRRTKEKVLTELPDKQEQVLFCEMDSEEKDLYAALRERYRKSLTEKIESDGLGKAKIHVLEALLRLRQAACHPGLIDENRRDEPSAKIQQLLNHVKEVTAEGHKALIFSQFTTLLGIVRSKLEQEGIVYEYLDGQTTDRKTPVERFQKDPKVPVFLISLKAGGVGLNLTAADYVFILDPWWNPAVEAQAIGRAHRMGQANKVFAYRMIAKGTVEEKLLELQKSKRELAESLISEDQDFLKNLTKSDLEMLLE